MIPIRRTNIPKELTEELQKELTERFKNTGESVWNLPFLKTALLEMSHYKCVYSESKLQQEGKYMEIDHFLPKEKYKGEVLTWENLLPVNKKCNATKSNHDTGVEPILNPCRGDVPKEHLLFRLYRFYPKTELGKRTIEITALNDRFHFLNKRAEIGAKVIEVIANIWEEFEELRLKSYKPVRSLRRKRQKLILLLQEAQPQVEYSATVATILIHDTDYQNIKRLLQDLNEWNDELEVLQQNMLEIAFDSN